MKLETEAKNLKIALLVSALLLCVGVLPGIPYGFYTFLRLVVCGVGVYAAVLLRTHSTLQKHFIPLAILVTLFNPVIPVHLSRTFWMLIDIFTAV